MERYGVTPYILGGPLNSKFPKHLQKTRQTLHFKGVPLELPARKSGCTLC